MILGRRLVAAGAALVVLAGGAGVLVGREVAAPPPAAPAPAAATPPEPAAGRLVRYRDRAGWSIAYPSAWRRMRPPGGGGRLLVSGGAGASLLVRTARRPQGRSTRSLAARAGGGNLLGPPQRVRLGGLPAWRVFYLYEDDAIGRRGLHAHYFLARGRRLTTLVFQGAPVAAFRRNAPLFDRVARSFRAG